MILSDEEIIDKAANILPINSDYTMSIVRFARAIERAVLAKASSKMLFNGSQGHAGYVIDETVEAMPAHKQEPVHWRAVISDADKERNPIVSRHVVGFTKLSAAEEWAAAEHDFRGWNYTIEPLYICPAPPQAAAIPEAIKLLAEIFDLYEEGVDCYEDPESRDGYLGKAIRLDDELFHSCVTLLNSAAPKPEGK